MRFVVVAMAHRRLSILDHPRDDDRAWIKVSANSREKEKTRQVHDLISCF